ncbi:hypothetical protein ACWDNI_20170 [Nocardia niigatensis]
MDDRRTGQSEPVGEHALGVLTEAGAGRAGMCTPLIVIGVPGAG